jgi:hypothetical protein
MWPLTFGHKIFVLPEQKKLSLSQVMIPLFYTFGQIKSLSLNQTN